MTATKNTEPLIDPANPSPTKLIYQIIKRTVEKIWETYCRTDETHATLSEAEIKRFLCEFLQSHNIDKDGIDIVYTNMDTNGDQMIDKYEMFVFFAFLWPEIDSKTFVFVGPT